MAILRDEFPVTELTPALDLRGEISRLHTVINRSTAERGRQIENEVAAVSGTALETPEDDVVPSTLSAYATYPELRDFRRMHDMAVDHAAAHGGAEVQAGVLAQVEYLLTEQGWAPAG